jgi:uncharacterized protein YkwD
MIAERKEPCNSVLTAALAGVVAIRTHLVRLSLILVLLTITAPASYLEERRVFELTNAERRRHHLQGLRWNDDLAGEARRHSVRMMQARFFSHEDPERGPLPRRLARSGFYFRGAAENLNYSRGYQDPAAAAVQGWMESPGHRKNLLDPDYTQIGIGVARAQDGTWYVTQIFLRPR